METIAKVKISIVGNCQVGTIADSLGLLISGAICERNLVSNQVKRLDSELQSAMARGPDVVILHDSVMRIIDSAPELRVNLPSDLLVIPTIAFSAFHPDIQYAFTDESVVKNGLDSDWNSRILLWAYLHGLPEHSAVDLFHEGTYDALGYFEEWKSAEVALSDAFSQCGLDYRSWMRPVQRTGNFMYGVNHPRAIGLKHLALQVGSHHFGIKNADIEVLDSLVDYLSHIVWPVFPEIGERLGVSGSRFWQVNSTQVELTEFTSRCYRHWDALKLTSRTIRFIPELRQQDEETLTRLARLI